MENSRIDSTVSWQNQVSFSERVSHTLKMQVFVFVLCVNIKLHSLTKRQHKFPVLCFPRKRNSSDSSRWQSCWKRNVQRCTIKSSFDSFARVTLNLKTHIGGLSPALQRLDWPEPMFQNPRRRGTVAVIVPGRGLLTGNRPNHWTLHQLHPPRHRPLLHRL